MTRLPESFNEYDQMDRTQYQWLLVHASSSFAGKVAQALQCRFTILTVHGPAAARMSSNPGIKQVFGGMVPHLANDDPAGCGPKALLDKLAQSNGTVGL